jgi:hypothetical protein
MDNFATCYQRNLDDHIRNWAEYQKACEGVWYVLHQVALRTAPC